ncbi:MAG: hypothetical protein R3F43_03465 [bacterium]
MRRGLLIIAVCGDGAIQNGEECDDDVWGNVDAGDGCDATCQLEVIDLIRGIQPVDGGFGPGRRRHLPVRRRSRQLPPGRQHG